MKPPCERCVEAPRRLEVRCWPHSTSLGFRARSSKQEDKAGITTMLGTAAAALGRLLARLAGLPAPGLTGLLAGLFYVAAPQVTRYAQEGRAYAIVTMLVTVATYLLVRAMMASTWRWWACYALVIVLAGLFNLFSLLLVLAHGVTVLLTYLRRRRAAQTAHSGPAEPGPADSGAVPGVGRS